MSIHRALALLVPASLLVSACGGTFDAGTGGGLQDGGSGGAASGGAGGTGGSAAGGAGSGGLPGTGGQIACCLAMVTCNPGDTEISGPDACPPGASCYSNTICCSTVWCARAEAGDGGSCDPSAEYNRSYVGSSPAECALIDFMCPPNTTYFGNACGCGCEQASTCPEWVDCMPGPGTLNPLCTTEGHAMCPYTKLAF